MLAGRREDRPLDVEAGRASVDGRLSPGLCRPNSEERKEAECEQIRSPMGPLFERDRLRFHGLSRAPCRVFASTEKTPRIETLRVARPKGADALTLPRARCPRGSASAKHSSARLGQPMLLNRVEKAMMNNPLRAAIQRLYEAERLISMGGPAEGKVCLEIGCGRGVGTEIILDRFGAARVDAFDLDEEMVAQAKDRLASRGDRVRLWTGSATEIPAEDGVYGAVFDFGIVHHVPEWRRALAEVYRVLEPGGRFYAEEVLAYFIHHPLWRRLLEHPMADRFDRHAFQEALQTTGFRLVASGSLGKSFAFFVADKPL